MYIKTVFSMSSKLKWFLSVKNLLRLSGIGILLIISFFVCIRIGVFGKLPDVEEFINTDANKASEVYSADSVLLGKYYIDNRINIEYKDLSPWLVKGLKSVKSENRIILELTRNMFHNHHHGVFHFFITEAKQYVLMYLIKQRFSNDEIVTMYFNSFDFVNNAVGIESASRIYFNKKAKELTVEEASVFIAMLENPSYCNPRRFEQRTLECRNIVLNKMHSNGFISSLALDTLKSKPIQLNFHPESPNNGIAPYFRMVLKEELKKWTKENKRPDGTEYNIYSDGLKIYTTINARMQQYAEEAAIEHLAGYQKIFDSQFGGDWKPWETEYGIKILETACKYTDRWTILKENGFDDDEILKNFKTDKHKIKVFTYKGMKDTILTPYDSVKYYKSFLQVGFMVMEVNTGHVLAWVGGPNFEFFKNDHCRESTKRQIGSTFKAIVYSLAVDNGWSPCMPAPGIIRIGNWKPKGGGGGQILKQSFSTSSGSGGLGARMAKEFGVIPIIDMARKMGVTSELPPYSPLALGAADVSLSEMMCVYSTFPNAGVATKPQIIVNILNKDGTPIGKQKFENQKTKVFSDNTAYKMIDIMKGVSKGGIGASLCNYFTFPVGVAGKTGTTNKNTDAWFIGYTPELIAGVWVGCDDPLIHFLYTSTGQGGRAAMPVFGMFMQKAYSDEKLSLNKKATFFKPSDTTLINNICHDSTYNKDVETDKEY